MDTQTETWHHSLIIDDTDPIDELGYDWSPPPHGTFLGHDGSLSSPVTVDQAFMNSKYMPSASPISPEAQDAWSPDVYKDGLKRLSRFAEGLTGRDVIAVEDVDEAQAQVQAQEEQRSYLMVETQESSRYHRPPTPSPAKLSNLSPVAEVPPLPSSLPARTMPKVPSSPPVIKRAYTMRSPARPTFGDVPRPRSSSQAHSHSESYQKLTGEFEFAVPVAQSRPRRPSKSSMRKLSVSSRSATPVNIIVNNVGLSEGQTGAVGVWESTGDNHGTLDIPDLRPGAPTPSATASAFQYPMDLSSPGTPFSAASTTPSFSAAQQSVLASRATTSTTRARSRSISTGRPGTPPPPAAMPSTAPMAIPDEYTTEPFTVPVPAPPTTPPPRSFARPPKTAAYPDPNGFPTPPSYPPVPGLVASGSASTSTRSSAYTSPGTSIPLSSSDLSAVGLGLTGRAEVYHATHDDDDEVVLDMGINATQAMDKALPSLPRTSSYATSTSASVSESSITRLQMATNAAAQSATHAQTITPNSSWTSDAYATSTRSGSSYDGSPVPLSRNASSSAIRDQGLPKKKTPIASSLWRSEDELDDENDMEEPEQEQEQPSVASSSAMLPSTSMSFSYQRPRQGTFASSRSASVSGLTSASEDETDADDYAFLREIEEGEDEEVRTAAIVVAEEGRGLIVHGEGMDVAAVNIQPGTTHLLLSSSASPHSIPGLLTQTLPNIASTLLALDISANFLGALPPALAACTQLTELNVASNPLRALPVWLSSLDQLRVLIADATGISTLPAELSPLKALNVLSIRRNKFVSLPPWLSHLPELERLEVEGNPFQGPWKALTAPLVATRAANTTTSQPQQTQSQTPQPPSISTSSSTSDLGSVFGPGMSMYGDSLYSHPPLTPGSSFQPVQGSNSAGYDELDGMGAGSGMGSNQANGSGRKLANSNEEEDHTIMPRRSLYSSSSQLSLPVPLTPSQFPLPTTPMTPAIPPSAAPSHQSFASSVNSPTQLPYMSQSPRPDSDTLFSDKQEGSSSSPLQRVPTFSSAPDRGLRTPSPYLRPLSRTRTTPSRSTRMSSGSVATFVADVGHGGERSRTSSAASQQQRPHTDYVSRYKATNSTASASGSSLPNGNLEDSGYYGSVNIGDYSAYRRSDGSEFFANGYENHQASTSKVDDERSNQLRRMRSADELRRALEPVIGPSAPLALPEDDDNGGSATETDRRPPFQVPNVPRLDMRPGLKHNFTSGDAETISPGKGMPLLERPPPKRFASIGPMASVSTKSRPALTDSMWDNGADADADVEPDNEDTTLRKSRPTSPDPSEVPQQPQTQRKSRKWGFFKKMSMGRIRPDTSSGSGSGSGKPSRSVSGSTQTSPQGPSSGSISRAGAIPPNIITSNGASPSPKMRHQPSRDRLAVNLSPVPPSASPITPISATARSPNGSGLGVPQSRAARRRSFLPLDGPPALNIPIPRTSPFMPEALIVTNDEDEGARNAITPVLETPPTLQAATPTPPPTGSVSAISPGPPSSNLSTVPATPPSEQQPQVQGPEADAQHSRALRSVMAYLRDMADLGMANSSVPAPAAGAPLTASLDAPTSVAEARSRRPTVVEGPRVMSDGSITSSAGSSSLRSEEQRANTMSVATTESDGSGKAEEEKPSRGVKDDKVRRAALVKEIVDTERTYVQGLQELIDIYIKPASQPVNTIGNAVAGTKETVVPAPERKIAFNGVDSLYSFHSQSFLPALEKAARPLMMQLARPDTDVGGDVSMAAALAVANVFVSHAAFMRMYSTYINNFDNAVARLKAWAQDPRRTPNGALSPSSSTAQLAGMVMSVVNVPAPEETAALSGLPTITSGQRKRIKQFMKRARLNPKHSQINLESYLLLPVQRIPRYRLLLEELVRCTPPKLDMPDDPIDRALSEIASLANNMNEGKRESESRRRLVQWQSRIKGKFPSPLVQPHRRLIMDGSLNLKRVVRKSLTAFDIINSEGTTSSVQVECLAAENTPRTLVGVLCNDLLVLCKDPSEGKDKNGPVDLWAVLRMQTLATPASIDAQGHLRVVDNKAILYFDVPSSSSTDALTWCRAINMNVASKP